MTKKFLTVLAAVALAGAAMAQTTRTVREVTVEGLKTVNETGIKTVMRLKPGQPVDQASMVRDEEEIYSLGLFSSVKILKRDVGDSEADLTVQVKEYPVIKEIRIEGNTIFSDEELLPLILAQQEIGQIWNNNKALTITNEIRQKYTDKGFLINFEQFGPLEESEGTLNVKILETVVGKITLEGLNRTKVSTIERMMKSKAGKPINYKRLQQDIEELYYTYWFEDIKGGQSVGDRPEVVDITLTFKEARTAQINAGVALDPQSRLVGTASFSESNFKGKGQSVGLELEMATVGGGPSARLAFADRFIDNRDTAMSINLFSKVVYNFTGNGLLGSSGSSSTNENQFNERQNGLGISFTRPFGDTMKASVGLTVRNTKTINLTTTTTDEYVQQDGDLIILQIGAEKTTALPTVEPVQGQSFRVLLEPGYSNITKIGGNVALFADTLGSSNFIRSTLSFKKYWSKQPHLKADETPEIGLAKPRPVLAFKMEYGYISGTVPFFEQLFVGGTNSLRGYPNQRFWGSNSLVSTLEYRYPIQKSFNLVGFIDYGGAWGGYGQLKDFAQSNSFDMHLGYGVGLGFRTPLGPIRIEFAFDDQGKSRTHFTVGSSF
ncbi:MAG: outer membrane protein assembly factor [Fimbriimonadaceae bacterium]